MEAALTMAAQIASKSPVAVQGTKDNLNFSRSDFCDDFVVVVVVVVGVGGGVVGGGGNNNPVAVQGTKDNHNFFQVQQLYFI